MPRRGDARGAVGRQLAGLVAYVAVSLASDAVGEVNRLREHRILLSKHGGAGGIPRQSKRGGVLAALEGITGAAQGIRHRLPTAP